MVATYGSLYFYGATAFSRPGPPPHRDVTITQMSNIPHSVVFLWTSDQTKAGTSA